LGATLTPVVAQAAITGNIAGVVTDQATGKPLAGVTVTVSGPALQGEQTEFTDSSGRYIITELPPGEYIVRFYFSNIKVERPGIFISADKTLPVNAAVPTQKASTQTYRIVERAPTVDVANTQVQTQVSSELVRNTPFGRNYNSVLTLAPGAALDAVGFSFGGATGPENNFLIDGLNATNPGLGLQGTNFSVEFIKETEIITGGYNAEYGRATGGVVNVITKSGSNEFHGGAWFFYTPFQLTPPRVGRVGEAIASTGAIPTRINGVPNVGRVRNAFDFGFDLGGPIVKDKVWFYVGFHPQFTTWSTDKIYRTRIADNVDADPGTGAYRGDTDPNQKCPPWIDQTLCPTGGFITRERPDRQKRFDTDFRTYQYIGKLNFQLSPNHQLILQYIGTATNLDYLGTLNGFTEEQQRTRDLQTHDTKIHWIGKFLDRKLQLDVFAGYHGEANRPFRPLDPTAPPTAVTVTRTTSLSEFEDLPECLPRVVGTANRTFNPCPVTNYRYGGIGQNTDVRNHRGVFNLGLTYFLRAAGTHGIKFGFDFEGVAYQDRRFFTGAGNFQDRSLSTTSGTAIRRTQYATEVFDPATGENVPRLAPEGFNPTTVTTNQSFYLRDSWNVGFVPGLTINAGVRWELQQVRGANGDTVINIPDNVAPRVGFIYDFTRKGLSKFFASYGRFYESIPLDINDRQFSGEGLATQFVRRSACTNAPASGRIDPFSCTFPDPTTAQVNGGVYGAVSPVLRGQFTNEVVAGIQYDVGLDIVLGAQYQYRNLGRIIEDLSPDGGINYIVANPGDKTDQNAVRRLQDQIRTLENQINNPNTDPAQLPELRRQRQDTSDQLARYRQVESFPKPRREYHALIVTATKRFARNFSLLVSYTYSRVFGNYPGTFSPSNGQLDPNISSQYDLRELILNRSGPFFNDHPHNIKVTGNYVVPFRSGGLNFGVNFSAQSGSPILALGAHPVYGRFESFLIPQGSAGRTPFFTNFDLRIAYYHQFTKLVRFEVSWEIFNLFNQRAPLTVDNEYTSNFVAPVQNGRPADILSLRDAFTGNPIVTNSNYGQPTSYQAPLSMRFGVRVSF
jgi:hypothetical protein